ncbi:MAG: hypothetical protein J3T61_00340 [Candidatus Brocadiales bacterium]|nr:hypothetical protein [Candidatus Bathyanammoxibius sp.]
MNKRERLAFAFGKYADSLPEMSRDAPFIRSHRLGLADAAIAAIESGKRGTRLPESWQPSDAGIQFCSDHGLNLGETFAQFSDYWIAQPGQRGIKRDWDATWRNWCRGDKKAISPVEAVSQTLDPGMAKLLGDHGIVAGSFLVSHDLFRSATYRVLDVGGIATSRIVERTEYSYAKGPWPQVVV